MSSESSTLVSRVIGLSGEGRLINGMKKKFASANSKLHRICAETGNVNKLEKLLTSNKDIDLSTIKFVSDTLVFRVFYRNVQFICIVFIVEHQ